MVSIKPRNEYTPASCFLRADYEADTVRASIDDDGQELGDVCLGCIGRILREPERLPDMIAHALHFQARLARERAAACVEWAARLERHSGRPMCGPLDELREAEANSWRGRAGDTHDANR